MANEIKVSEELAGKFATEKDRNTPYVRGVTSMDDVYARELAEGVVR
jgi:hypothetical protein